MLGRRSQPSCPIGMWSVFPLRKEVVHCLCPHRDRRDVRLRGRRARSFDDGSRQHSASDLESQPEHGRADVVPRNWLSATGTTDLSAFFRVIHWSDIWDLYASQGLGVILFGFGSGQTESLSPTQRRRRTMTISGYWRNTACSVAPSFVVFVATILASLKGAGAAHSVPRCC